MSQADVRRKEATKAFVRYFIIGMLIVGCLSGLTSYSLMQTRAQRAETMAIRTAYCQELEKLKTQNREDLARSKRNYKRDLRLLGIKNTKELRKATEESWAIKAKRNAAKPCPYTA